MFGRPPNLTRLLRFPNPFAVAAAVADRIDPTRHRGRRVWRSGDGRLHLGVHGVGQARGSALARAVERALREHPAVSWAVVNPVLGAAVIAGTGGEVDLDELVDVVEAVERAHPESSGVREPTPPNPAATDAVNRAVTAIAADLAGLSVGGLARLLRRARLPAELASVITFVDTQPRLRGGLERAVGAERAEVLLSVTNAVAQALAQGSSGLTVDLGRRALQLGEARARQRAWVNREPELAGSPGLAAARPVTGRRPIPLSPGPIERFSEHMGVATLGAFAGTLAVSRDPARAGAVALSTLPKAAAFGREGFADTLGWILARRGVLLMDPSALRRLDRIGVVVLDADVLTTGRFELGDLISTNNADPGELSVAAHSLFIPDAPQQTRQGGGFELAPIPVSQRHVGAGARPRAALLRGGATDVLGLARGGRLEAVIGLSPEPSEAADALAAAARRAGLTLIVAGPPSRPDAAGLPGAEVADRTVPGGDRLAAAVRELQATGQGVLLVSPRRDALAVADCGVGVSGADRQPAWGAHVLVGTDLTCAAMLIDAAGVAAVVSRRSVTTARVGTALAAAVSLGGRADRLSNRTLLVVDGAAAVALASGAWSAVDLTRRPVIPPVSHVPWHLMPAQAVLRRVGAPAGGLTTRQAGRRRRPGEERQPPPTTLARSFLTELANPLTPILVGGAGLSASIGAVVDAGIIVGVTAVSALLGAVQRTTTERAVAGLLERSATVARVYRDGALATLPSTELVVGDVVVVEPGDVVPADCRILTATALEVDESSLTGESMPVTKCVEPVIAREVAERRSMLYESTTVAAGRGSGVVVATGGSTEAGRSMAATRTAAPTTGVETRLAQITRTTLPIALGSAGAVMVAGLLRGYRTRDTVNAGVALAVASVPEGLPFLVSAAQLAAARRLSARGALVRNPRTIEALGRVDVLCFDKTGTLTEGRIALRAVSDGHREQALKDLDGSGRAVLAAGVRSTPQAGEGRRLAHSTDVAVLRGAAEAGVAGADDRPAWRPVDSLPFAPGRAYHATLAEVRGGVLLSVKGAPELVIPRCASWHGEPLNPRRRATLAAATTRLARSGYRVLAVAERSGPAATGLDDQAVGGLDFVGFLLFADPVRATSGASVRDLRDAGVQVVMITGDHPDTAEAIAAELDVGGDGMVVTGAELDELDDEALDALLPRIAVVARGTPTHKVRVVHAFQRLGRTVAMTGDGANDAAAIRLADVGIALGRRGTPAARAAADLVVLDDRIETILAALVEGRAMWGSVRRALGILVGGNLGEIAFTLFGAGATGVSPLSARQLLLVNLLTDLAPALAVALRPPETVATGVLLAEGPEVSLGAALTQEVTVRACATAAGATSAWVLARLTGRRRRARTVGLVALVGTQLGQTLLAGGRSPSVLGASLGSAAVLVTVVQTPGLSHFFGCTPLGPVGWLTGCGAALVSTAGTVLLTRPVARLEQPPTAPRRGARHGVWQSAEQPAGRP